MVSDTKTAQRVTDALEARGMNTEGLTPVGVRPGLGEYVAQVWGRRHFIWMDARHRVATQNSRNKLGSLWLLLKPLLDALMYFVIFALVLKVQRAGIENYPGFIIIGVLMFRSTMSSFGQGSAVLRSNQSMIRAFSFPRASLPISTVLRDALQMGYTVTMMIIMIMAVPNHEQPEWTWFLVPVIFALQVILNLGITLTLARVGFIFPDTTQFMSFVGRFLMYGSGVIFPIDRFLSNDVAMRIIETNPIYHMIVMYREVLMDGVVPSLDHWLILGAWALGLTVFGFIFFWRGEETYGGGQ